MSEPVLKAIMRLFALVAKEDQVTHQERDHIRTFLTDHLSQKAVAPHLQLFDDYSHEFSGNMNPAKEEESIKQICAEINVELAQKQKTVIILELMSIILADGSISPREETLTQTIGNAFNISKADIELIKTYVLGQHPNACHHEDILIINSDATLENRKHIFREELDGFVAILYVRSTDIYFFKYHGKTDVYLNGVPQKPGNINVLATGSTIRWETADPVYYGDSISHRDRKSVV